MRIRHFFILVTLCFGCIINLKAQSFAQLWKEAEQFEKKSLPQDVIRQADKIYRKAEAEGNTPQMLKAYSWRMKYREKLSPDSFYVHIKELEGWLKRTEKPLDRAVLHTMIANIYADYYENHRWGLQARTNVVDSVYPEDIREWTANMFVQTVFAHNRESLKERSLLLRTSSKNYIPFVELGSTSEYFRHDLYHLLGTYSITSLRQIDRDYQNKQVKDEISLLYKQLIETYRSTNNVEAFTLLKLDSLEFAKDAEAFNSVKNPVLEGVYLPELDRLIADYGKSAICAEVYLTKANYFYTRSQYAKALKICEEAIGRYGRYERINALKNLKNTILTPCLYADIYESAYPGEKIRLKVRHKNLKGFTWKISQGKKVVLQQHYALVPPTDYEEKDTSFYATLPNLGKYSVEIVPDSPTKTKDKQELCVRRLKALSVNLPGNLCEVVVVDSKTGHLVSGATVNLYDQNDKWVKELQTDAEGKCTFSRKESYQYVTVSKDDDRFAPKQNIRYYQRNDDSAEDRKGTDRMTLFTDRSIYRPGQLIYVKGIVHHQLSDTAQVIAGKEYSLKLLDANYQEIASQQVKTNEFGSFTTSLALPASCLNGVFNLTTSLGSTSLKVENYKRPTFEVKIDPVKALYKVGDRVTVAGKVQTLSGSPLQAVTVQYKVRCSAFYYWRFKDRETIGTGEVVTDEKGNYSIPVSLDADKSIDSVENISYTYEIEATVTSQSGETQSATYSLSAGKCNWMLKANDFKELVCKDRTVRPTIAVWNFDSQMVSLKGVYRLYRLAATDKPERESEENDKNSQIKKGEPIQTGSFISNTPLSLEWQSLPSGRYSFEYTVTDSIGNQQTDQATFTLFSTGDVRPPVPTNQWVYAERTEFNPHQPAVFYYGTSLKDAQIMMYVLSNNRLVERRVLKNVSDSIMRFEYPYQESYGDGVSVNFYFVKDGTDYSENIQLKKSTADKTVSMKWSVFRDKLRPGQKEEWRLTIKTPQGSPADAEMLAMMYDASLDQIWKRPQFFNLFYRTLMPSLLTVNSDMGENYFSFDFPRKGLQVPKIKYDQFHLFPLFQNAIDIIEVYSFGQRDQAPTLRSAKANTRIAATPQADEVTVNAKEVTLVGKEGVLPISEKGEPRTNFNETAFFYPQLRTNEAGEIVFSFTMPESLTRWQFCGFAHTKGMLTGTLEDQVTTSKDFMLMPNWPRFTRVGDRISFPATLSNLTHENQKGTVRFVVFDPTDDRVLSTQQQKFSVQAGATTAVSFSLEVPSGHQLLGYRMLADGLSFSDGEQQVIPVFSNQENVVETKLINLRGEVSKKYKLEELFNHQSKSATNRRLTIELTANPVWYAVQALPSLNQPTTENAISLAIAYYANTLASYILQNQPRLKAVFDNWRLQGGTKETLLSSLQKNPELKNILLSESPWVMEARSEQQQKQRLATLFDLNNVRYQNADLIAKLKTLQLEDGSWSWYKGMRGDWFTTTFLMKLWARLAMLTGEQPQGTLLEMQNAAFGYLHKQALENYRMERQGVKGGEKRPDLSTSELKYLYLIAITGEKVPDSNREFYKSLLNKLRHSVASQTVEEKSLTTVILKKAGYTTEAKAFAESLKQFLTQTEDLGMFFDFKDTRYASSTENILAHVAAMEAFESVGEAKTVADEMKIWLLRHKQTQQWSTSIASADAVYALLMTGKGQDLLQNKSEMKAMIANEVLDTRAAADGLGYVKRTFDQEKVTKATSLTIQKNGEGIAWGAVYAQYESPLNELKQQGEGLKIKKELYVERMRGNETVLEPINERTALKAGDKIVSRLTVQLDRTLDFVQLKDQHAACFEPVEAISGYRWTREAGYYMEVKDASTQFFFDHLSKGVYVLENRLYVNRLGTYEGGIATLQSAYAPEWSAHSSSTQITVR